MRQFYVYILAGHSRQLYTGVTSDLPKRVFQHREGVSEFTSKYCISRLVYFETTENVMSAIAREKQIKSWRRSKKLALISSSNPGWDDLAEEWFADIPDHSPEPSPQEKKSGTDV